MKKVISILLACLMIFGCMPVLAFAAATDITATTTQLTSVTLYDGDRLTLSANYTLSDGAQLTVNSGATVIVKEGAALTAQSGGQIINNGTIIVESGAGIVCSTRSTTEAAAAFYNGETGSVTLEKGSKFRIYDNACVYNKGKFDYASDESLLLEPLAVLRHWIKFPQNFEQTYSAADMWNRSETTVSFDIKYTVDSSLKTDTGYLTVDNYFPVPASGTWVSHKDILYILITPESGDGDWIDTGRMQIAVNKTILDAKEKIDNSRGVFVVRPNGAMDISIESVAYEKIVKLFDITLPKTEGYYVQTVAGEVDNVIVPYGKELSFTVILADDYDKSDFYAYANGVALTPDEFGYFDITGPFVDYAMASKGGVQEDISITIMGVSSNASQEQMSSIVNFIKEIFDVIKSIFGYFSDLFSGLFGSLGDLGGGGSDVVPEPTPEPTPEVTP